MQQPGVCPFALAADHVLAREDVVLNPYYGHIGGLYGSRYWTCLPRRVGGGWRGCAHVRAVRASRSAPRGGAWADRRRLRRHRRAVPRRRSPLRHAAGLQPRQACRGAEAPLARPRRATQTARRLPCGRARAIARVLLARPQLPRGPTPLRLQTRSPDRGPIAVMTLMGVGSGDEHRRAESEVAAHR